MDKTDNDTGAPEAEENDMPGDEPENSAQGGVDENDAGAEHAPAHEAGGGGEREGEQPPIVAVTELGNTADGCWKVLRDGERIVLTDQEWRVELARLLARSA